MSTRFYTPEELTALDEITLRGYAIERLTAASTLERQAQIARDRADVAEGRYQTAVAEIARRYTAKQATTPTEDAR